MAVVAIRPGRLAALLLLAAAFAVPASAQKGAAADRLDIRVCNQSGRDAFAAIIYRDGGRWHSGGWFRVDSGGCEVVATSDHLRFYVFAEEVGNVDHWWGGGFVHCILRPGPYDELVDLDAKACRPDQVSVRFAEWLADEYGTFTWTLDP